MTEPPLEAGEVLDYGDFRKGARMLARARAEAVEAYIEQAEVAAKAEANYQATKAMRFIKIKAEATATEAEATVKGQPDVREKMIQRDVEAETLRARMERIRSIDAERASLHQLAQWAMKLGLD